MYVPNRGDYVQAFDGASGELLWEYRRVFPADVSAGTNRSLAIWGTTLIDAGSDNTLYAIDARTGKLVWETPVHAPTLRARATSGPIIAERQGHHGPSMPARRDARSVRHDGARRGDGQGALEGADDSAAGRAGRFVVGRRAHGAALARRHLDGAELRSRARSRLRRHVGHDTRGEVHSGRSRRAAPLSQLDARARRRIPGASSGTTSISSTIGISIIRSSGCSSTRASRRIRAKSLGSIRGCAAVNAARPSREFPARRASSTRSIARPASSCGRARRSSRTS